MSRYVTLRLTREQAFAASNACDLIRDSLEADNMKRDAAIYARAAEAISSALSHWPTRFQAQLTRRRK
jgi:hypothetical protein